MENMRKIDYLAHKKPDKLAHITKEIYRNAPEEVERMLEQYADGEHISSKEEYEEHIKTLKWSDGRGKGERWGIHDIIKTAEKLLHIDFEEEEYTEFDFCFLVNMLYAIFCKIHAPDMTTYLRMAQSVFDYAENDSQQLYGDFFKPVKKEKKHHESRSRYEDAENRYRNSNDDEYNEENRRRYRHRYYDDRY